MRLGVRTGHPRFFNQISCGLDLVSMAGEWLTATANTNMYDFIILNILFEYFEKLKRFMTLIVQLYSLFVK